MKPALIFLLAVALFAVVYFIIRKPTPIDQTHLSMETTPNNAFKKTPLHAAAEDGYLEQCEELLASAADVNALDDFGWTPLIHAVQNGHIEIVKLLLDSGADMHYQYQREDTPEERTKKIKEQEMIDAHLDLKKTMEESFKELPEGLRDELSSDDMAKEIAQDMLDLHFEPQTEHALEHCNSLPMLKVLIAEYKADIDWVASDGTWPLSDFTEFENTDAVIWLLENGANPNNTSTGETAVFKAVRNNNLELVKLLIKHGAKIDVEDVDGWSVLFPCESIEIARYLIDQGADPTSLDQCGFPCWNMVDDQPTKEFLKQEAIKRWLGQVDETIKRLISTNHLTYLI